MGRSGVGPVVLPAAVRGLVVPVLSASRQAPVGPVADALATVLGAARMSVTAPGGLLPGAVAGVVADGLPAAALALAATGWPDAVPVLLVAFTPAGVRSAADLLAAVGPGVAGRTVLAAVAPSTARPPALAYALLHVTAGLAAAAVALPHPDLARGRRLSVSVAALAAAVRHVPAPIWPAASWLAAADVGPVPAGPRSRLLEAS